MMLNAGDRFRIDIPARRPDEKRTIIVTFESARVPFPWGPVALSVVALGLGLLAVGMSLAGRL